MAITLDGTTNIITGSITSFSGTLPVTNGGTGSNAITFANLATNVAGTLPVTNGGTGSNAITFVSLTTNVAGTLPVTNGGTGSNAITFANLATNVAGTLPVTNGGTGVTISTGSGAVVLSTSPTLVTPILGTPTSGTLSSCTVNGTDGVGYINIPQNSQSAAYTLVLADSGKHILHPSADTTARTFTIPANASVAYTIGTAITFVNQASAGVMTIAITSDTMRWAGYGTTGSRMLAANGVATAIKLSSIEWIISGTGLS